MSGAKERPQSTDVQSDTKKYAEGWEAIWGKKENNAMVYVDGSKRSFHCEDCGANAFTQLSGDKFECNGCGARYTGNS